MIVKNLTSCRQWEPIVQKIADAFATTLSVGQESFDLPRPFAVLLADIPTMDWYFGTFSDTFCNSFLVDYGVLARLSNKPEHEISTLLTEQGAKLSVTGQPGVMCWADAGLRKHLKETHGLTVDVGSKLVFVSPEAIEMRIPFVEDFFHRLIGQDRRLADLADRIVRIVVWHEMSHASLEPRDAPQEPRLAEGLANLLVYRQIDDLGKQVLHCLACMREMDFCRNYYHLLRCYESITCRVLHAYLSGQRGKAFNDFAAVRRHAEFFNAVETNGGRLRIRGEVKGESWLAYAARKKNLALARTLPVLCNIESGVVLASSIGRIVGFLPEQLTVYTNRVGMHEYPRLPTNIKLVDPTVVDIGALVAEGIWERNRSEEELAAEIESRLIN